MVPSIYGFLFLSVQVDQILLSDQFCPFFVFPFNRWLNHFVPLKASSPLTPHVRSAVSSAACPGTLLDRLNRHASMPDRNRMLPATSFPSMLSHKKWTPFGVRMVSSLPAAVILRRSFCIFTFTQKLSQRLPSGLPLCRAFPRAGPDHSFRNVRRPRSAYRSAVSGSGSG